ncbi:acyl-CoA dehydrogenase family protein [Pigmentiphaga sp. H8]|uniref:acyl-CoA dehydrogenase family protein n=1 Tax=Pigmentiphaga sp. H8 TaxID=2488560 RepID=UPI00137583A3|nr:acyl-CoA dehydrogenase family protein [Pigmentiphaga sp. H8]
MDFKLPVELQRLREQIVDIATTKMIPTAKAAGEMHGPNRDIQRILAEVTPHIYPVECGGRLEHRQRSLAICVLREEMSRLCPDADHMFAQQGLCGTAILFGGTDEQKRRFVPAIANMDRLASFAVTEESGSDAGGLKTTAVASGDQWVLNGSKRLISHAGVAGTYVIFASTDPSQRAKGVSAFVVEEGTPGLSGKLMNFMVPYVVGELELADCHIPRDNILGQPGEGFRWAMQTLDVFRAAVGAHSVGFAQGALDLALDYAQRRELTKHQAIQAKLAEMATEIQAARLMVWQAAWLKDEGQDRQASMACAMAKMYASEMAVRVVNKGVQIMGGDGLNTRYFMQRYYREVRGTTIYEGTSEIQRYVISRQLLREARPYEGP